MSTRWKFKDWKLKDDKYKHLFLEKLILKNIDGCHSDVVNDKCKILEMF